MSSSPVRKSVSRQQLYLALAERIERGDYAPGEWLPSERALAREYGVDRSAVRTVLQQLEERGLVVREPGRRPWVRTGGRGAQNLPSAASDERGVRTILVVVPQHPLYPASLALMHGINVTLRAKDVPYRLQVFDTHGENKDAEAVLESRALDAVIAEKIAGIILWHMGGDETVPRLRRLLDLGIPAVLVDRYPAQLSCDFVGVDNRAGIEDAIAYLRSLGHRKIAHLTSDERTTAVLERQAVYHDAMVSSSVGFRPEWMFLTPRDRPTDLKPAVDHFFGLPDPPTAICAMNDSLAHYFIAEAEARGRKAPQDFSIVGFDDLERYSPRPALLTTMHQPFDKIGRRAAELLLERLAAGAEATAPSRHVLLPAPLVSRSTCRALDVDD